MTSLRQRMLEDMQVRRLSPFTQRTYVETVARFARYFDRSPDRLGSEQIRAYQVYLATERGLATSSLLVAVSALRFLYRVTLQKRWPFDDVIPAPKKPQVAAGRAQPTRSGPVSRCGQAREASRHPDRLLRRRPAHLRGHCPHRVRHRQRTDGAAHHEGQGTEGPLRDALAEAARGSCAPGGKSNGPGTGSFPASAPRRRSRAGQSSSPASAPRGARASAKAVTPHSLRNAST